MQLVFQVLSGYPAFLSSAAIFPHPPGFSGALVWRLNTDVGTFCLRAGAPGETTQHLQERHDLMARAVAAGLRFVPAVLPACSGSTVVEANGRCWEVLDWLPGRADFHDHPTPARLRAAAFNLARLHNAWQPSTRMIGPCPAIARRLEVVNRPLTAHANTTDPLLAVLLRRTVRMLERWRFRAAEWLLPYRTFICSVQPCLRDVWHDHLLFEEEKLTGLVDYAGVGVDSVAADLARMLGSLVGDDDNRWGLALAAYREVRSLSEDEERLARILDRTGVIGGLSNWLRRLNQPAPSLSDSCRVAKRLEELLVRIESW